MPFVQITTAKKIDDSARERLNKEIGEIMPVLPGKNKDNTLLCISDGSVMFMRGEKNDGVFIDVRTYKKSLEDSKKEFSEKIHAIVKDVLKLSDSSCVYMSFLEFDNWSADGNYF
jgi:phenylpyruvate tautomerase PptA (4-oxalocrotonate tautomerase family)